MSRATYKPSTHPKNAKAISANPVIRDLIISIEVMSPINLGQLRAMHEDAIMKQEGHGHDQDQSRDRTMWQHALMTEISRCAPKPAYMRRTLEHPTHPTQHARIDQKHKDLVLKGILKPETLRRTFISIPALMAQIQLDIGDYLKESQRI
jgi:hypothetical protein